MILTNRELRYINAFLANGGNESKAMDASKMNQYQLCMLVSKLGDELDRREAAKFRKDQYEMDLMKLKGSLRAEKVAESFRNKKSRIRLNKY